MNESNVIIERIRRINKDYQQIELAVDEPLSKIKPGQSLLAWTSDSWNPYLREHWWPVDSADHRLVVERPATTTYDVGQVVNVLGPVGQPLRFRRSLRNVLLMAYETPPVPLLMTLPWLMGGRVSVTMVLLGSAVEYDTRHFPPEIEIIRGDSDMNWPDRVMTVGWADQAFVTVRPDDEFVRFGEIWRLFNELRADIPKNYLFGVFQPVLPCGVGGCHACMVRMKQGMRLVCTEGPAFDLSQVALT